jgi:hypothetical protein
MDVFGYAPNGVTGATPPAWLAIVMGTCFIALPFVIWRHNKKPDAQLGIGTTVVAWLFGVGILAYGLHLLIGG